MQFFDNPAISELYESVLPEPLRMVTDALGSEYSCTDSVCAYYEPLNETFTDMQITLEGKVPAYVQGDLINGCPTLFEVGKYQLTNFIDGFVRYNRYRLDGN
jgi:hypothetical protein